MPITNDYPEADCWSRDGDMFSADLEGEAQNAWDLDDDEGEIIELYAGVKVPLEIPDSVFSDTIEQVREWMWDQVGEAAGGALTMKREAEDAICKRVADLVRAAVADEASRYFRVTHVRLERYLVHTNSTGYFDRIEKLED